MRCSLLVLLAACTSSSSDDQEAPGSAGYVLGAVVETTEGRTTYFQAIPDLEGPYTNENAVEAPGNGTFLARGRDVFLGLAEAPEWVRYTVADDGSPSETGRMSLAGQGFGYVDYGNTLVADDLAVSVSSESFVAVTWNPETMEIVDTFELPHLVREGFSTEVWTTSSHDGLVYIPGRWADWTGERVLPGVSLTILDPRTGEMTVATDDRCTSGGSVLFDGEGTAWVMGDGRNAIAQMYANAGGAPALPNCLLRILPGETDFDPDFYVEMKSLTGGWETVTELEFASQDTNEAFTWVLREDALPEGVEPVSFDFWSYPVFELWQISLGETPTARKVEGMPLSVLGFTGSAVDGLLYMGFGDTEQTVVHAIDPATATATERFTMDGFLYGLYALE